MGYDPAGYRRLDWKEKLMLGTSAMLCGLAILLAVPTGGGSLVVGSLALSSTTVLAAGSAMTLTGTIIYGEAVAQATINYAKPSKKSDKEKANDHPSWVSKSDIDTNKSSHQNASDLLNEKYGSGNWKKGPKSEYNQIVKWIDRSLRVIIPFMISRFFVER